MLPENPRVIPTHMGECGKTGPCYPEIGARVRCRVVASSFAAATLSIVEVGDVPSKIAYRAVLKGNAFSEGVYVCDRVRPGDVVDCLVVAYSDSAIVVSQE